MAQGLKRWESPRREGRNAKGRGGSARQRQLRKQQQQQLRQRLQPDTPGKTGSQKSPQEESQGSFFVALSVE